MIWNVHKVIQFRFINELWTYTDIHIAAALRRFCFILIHHHTFFLLLILFCVSIRYFIDSSKLKTDNSVFSISLSTGSIWLHRWCAFFCVLCNSCLGCLHLFKSKRQFSMACHLLPLSLSPLYSYFFSLSLLVGSLIDSAFVVRTSAKKHYIFFVLKSFLSFAHKIETSDNEKPKIFEVFCQ